MLEYLYLPKMGFANFNGISSLIRKGQASCWLFAWFVQHGGGTPAGVSPVSS